MPEFLLANICAVTPDDTLQNAALWIKDGKIFRLLPDGELPPQAQQLPRTDGKGAFAVPGFIDLHIHGYAGHGPEQGTPEALWAM